MKNKKGDLDSVKVIGSFILVLLIIVVLAFILNDKVRTTISSMFNLENEAKEGATNVRCESLISNRRCDPDTSVGKWEFVPPPKDNWAEVTVDHEHCNCYERID